MATSSPDLSQYSRDFRNACKRIDTPLTEFMSSIKSRGSLSALDIPDDYLQQACKVFGITKSETVAVVLLGAPIPKKVSSGVDWD